MFSLYKGKLKRIFTLQSFDIYDMYQSDLIMFSRHLQKAKLKHGSAVIIRDSLRNEVSKQQMNAEELKEKREQQVIRLILAKTVRKVACNS